MTAMPLSSTVCTRLKSAHGPSHRCAGTGVECAECSYFYGASACQDLALVWLTRRRRGHKKDTA